MISIRYIYIYFGMTFALKIKLIFNHLNLFLGGFH
jgi:hypothetical protein